MTLSILNTLLIMKKLKTKLRRIHRWIRINISPTHSYLIGFGERNSIEYQKIILTRMLRLNKLGYIVTLYI